MKGILPLCTALLGLPCSGGRATANFSLPPERTGNVYLSSFGTDEIHCYAPNGDFLFRFGHADLEGPRGLVFVTGGVLYAAAERSDRILVFDAAGNYLRQFTTEGLDGPTSLAISPGGELHVSSFNSDEVLVFQEETFERAVTASGLNGPNCIAFAPGGDFYVVSQLDSRVYHFDPSGAFIRRFTGGGLSSAMGVAIYEGELFVTGGASDDVVVFDMEGNFQREITDPEIDGPQGIAFTENGNFSVSSFYTGRMALFDKAGARLQIFEESGVRVARSIAYRALGEEVEFIRGDYNRDRRFDISDPVALLGHLFLGDPGSPCADAGDSDDNGQLEITDAIHSLGHLFLGGPAPPPPFPEPGRDTTEDGLFCDL